MRLLIIAALLAAPIAADAQALYRCIENGKPTSFQNEPCPATARTASAVAYVPERNVPPYRPAAPTPPPQRHQQVSGARLHQIPIATSTTACEAARRHRQAVLGRNNQGGNVDVRRVLNDAVARACN